MMLDKIHTLQNYLNQLASSILIPSNQIHPFDATNANETISLIAKDIEKTNPNISQKLIRAKDNLFFYNDFGTINPNPVALGQVLAYINLLIDSETGKQFDEWNYIHPLILKSSKKREFDKKT